MKVWPLPITPCIERFAEKCAKHFNLSGNRWNIGADLIVYRNGNDSINWHADDTQEESTVLCAIIESKGARPVHIRAHTKKVQLKSGDENMILQMNEGEGYAFDGKCFLF